MNNRINYPADQMTANLLYAQPNNGKYFQFECDLYDETQQRDGINALPGEVLYKIFSMLTLKTLSSVNSVSKRWCVIENDRLNTLVFLSFIEVKQIFINIFPELNNYFKENQFPKNAKQVTDLFRSSDIRIFLKMCVEVFMEVHQSQNKTSDILRILLPYEFEGSSKLTLILRLFEHLTLKKQWEKCWVAPNADEKKILSQKSHKLNKDLFYHTKQDSTGFADYLLALVLATTGFNPLKVNKLVLKYLITSAEKKFPDAFWQLGDLYYFGDDPSAEDKLIAHEYYQRGADLNSPNAYHRLYLMSYNDDKEICHKYLSLAAEVGNKDAQFDLGDFYMRGNPSFERNIEKGFEYLEKAAYQNHIEAAFRLYIYYSMGVNTKKNNEKAEAFFNIGKDYFLSSRLLDLKYVFYIGLMFEEGREGEKDLNRAKKQYEKAAEKGCVKSLFALGTLIEERASAFNVDLMMQYFVQAADKGHCPSQFKMCQIFSRGLYGVPQDIEKARYYFKLLNSGQQNTFYEGLQNGNIGNCYMHGFGVEKDLKLAYEYFHKAATLNHANAEFKLCSYYHQKNDFEKSKMYFNLLSDPYHPEDILRLNERYRNISYCYAHGIGTNKDEKQAHHYKQLEDDTGMRFLTKTWI